MPTQIVIEIAPEEQAHLLAELRRARRGRWLALHILLLLALHRSPSEIATVLLCARSTVYAVARDWQQGRRWTESSSLHWPPSLTPSLQRSLLALLQKAPAAYGWCRTRWSCATLALQLEMRRSIRLSAETVRRCLHALDWVWKRAKAALNWQRRSKGHNSPSANGADRQHICQTFGESLWPCKYEQFFRVNK